MPCSRPPQNMKHVVVQYSDGKEIVQKSMMHLHSCYFVNLNMVFLLFSLKLPSSLLKLLNIKCGKLHPTDKWLGQEQ